MPVTPARKIDWPLVCFFFLAYALAWGVQLLIVAIAGRSGLAVDVLQVSAENLNFAPIENELTVSPWLVYGLTRIQDFSFSIAGLVMIAYVGGTGGLRELCSRLVRWRFDWRVYLVALLPLGLYGFAVLITAMTNDNILSGVDLSPRAIKAIFFGAESGLLVYLLTRGPLGEELGLRGFALPRLQTRHSPFKSASIIGFFWALWHLPVLGGRNPVEIVFFLVVAFCLSYIFTWLFNASRGSLIPVLLFHTTQNAEEIWEVVFPNLTSVDWELSSSLLLLIIGLGFGVLLWRQPKHEQVAT
jgi:membrane protease YdiL (CAAX protease family)